MVNKNKIVSSIPTVVIGLALAVVLAIISMIGMPQRAQAAPFECDSSFYQFIGTDLKRLNPATGVYDDIALGGGFLNGAGYNRLDNYIYGYENGIFGGDGRVMRVEDDGSRASIGTVSGLPVSTGNNYNSGDMDDSGNLYLLSGNGLYRVNIATVTATPVTLSAAVALADIVYIDGMLYGLPSSGSDLVIINPVTGDVTSNPLSGSSPTGTYGAGWAADDNKLYFAHNSSGMIYEILSFDTSTPEAIPVLQGQGGLTLNDGASCSLASSPIPPLFATDDASSTIANTPVTGNVISNDSGREITVTEYSQPINGVVVVNPVGSYTYTPNNGFVGTDSFTYTITDEYGETRTATVTITVTTTDVVSVEDETEELASTGIPQLPLLLIAMLSVGLTGCAVHSYAKRHV